MAEPGAWRLLLPRSAADEIKTGGSWGRLTCRVYGPDNLALVCGISNGTNAIWPVALGIAHRLNISDASPVGYWYAASREVAELAYVAKRYQGEVPLEKFRELIPQARTDRAGAWHVVVTYSAESADDEPSPHVQEFNAWAVTRDTVRPFACDVESDLSKVDALAPHWPVDDLRPRRALVIGSGSIGGATAVALASFGIGNIDVVDPDRLAFHNLPRHVCPAPDVGRFKVDALHDLLEQSWPDSSVRPFRSDAVEHADILRALVREADVVVCTVDGVEPRRVASYVCKRANTPLVLACVLEDGRYGEILRMRGFPEVGCLDCQRRALVEAGGIDLESTLDRRYGEGTRHNPMTAVGGDLHLVGTLAAKEAVALLLEQVGHIDQRLNQDNLVIALRPAPVYSAPFDASRLLETRWYAAAKPRTDCRTCQR